VAVSTLKVANRWGVFQRILPKLVAGNSNGTSVMEEKMPVSQDGI